MSAESVRSVVQRVVYVPLGDLHLRDLRALVAATAEMDDSSYVALSGMVSDAIYQGHVTGNGRSRAIVVDTVQT